MKWEKIVVQPSKMEFRDTTRLKGAALTLLSVLAVGQVVALESRTPQLDPLDPRVTVGHDVSELVVRDSGGAAIELGAPYETLLLVFDPDCVHSARVAETWASWLAKAGLRTPIGRTRCHRARFRRRLATRGTCVGTFELVRLAHPAANIP